MAGLRTREQVQGYLYGVANEIGVPLEGLAVALELDKKDPLARFREKFEVPTIGELLEEEERDPGVNVSDDCMYFCGNSLGLQPKNARALVEQEMHKWSKKGIRGVAVGTFPWFHIEDLIADENAKIIGCKSEEVTAMNALTANIHFALGAFYRPTKERYKIVMEDRCFPSDLFAVQSQIRLHGYDPETALVQVPSREGELLWRTEDIVKVIEEQSSTIALVFFSGIHYATGHMFDIKTITEAAHKEGICVGFDLAHAAGNVELHLHDWGVDFAMWCSYKYMNAGPGGIGGFYVHERHGNDPNLPRLLGWWSQNREIRINMPKELDLVMGARGFNVSNPPVLECMLLKASLDVFSATSMEKLCEKSRLITGYLELLMERNLTKETSPSPDKYVTLVTSQDPAKRGCQLSFQFSWPIDDVQTFLMRNGAVVDLRHPLMRVAPTPLYNSFVDVLRFFQLLMKAVTGNYSTSAACTTL